jgi:hypothetical protein
MEARQLKSVRQGDVCLIRIEKLPAGCVEVLPEGDRVVLAYGEVTGHSHAVYGVTKEAPNVRLWSAGAERFLQVLTRSDLQHEEHSTVVLEPGIYQLPGQYEFSEEHAPRQVAD